ncbi:MAG TPA: flagellar motor protein MotB [Marinagarivorans sp.]
MSDDEKSKCNCKKGLPPWMGTFADLMALLMCFFVLLLSFSEMDAMKFKRLAGSMAQAFGVQNKVNVVDPPKGTSIIAQEFSPGRPEPTPINEIFQSTQDVTEMSLRVDCAEDFDVEQGEEGYDAGIKARLQQVIDALEKETEKVAYELADALSEQILKGQIEIETEGRKIIIRIRERGSFGSGSATLAPEYRDVLQEVQAVLALKPGHVKVEGHTDNLPINTARFRSNWELSAARAVSVAHELMRGGAINQRRFEVSGMADAKPLASNNSAENRAKNRRVEIKIIQGLDNDMSEEDKAVLQSPDGADILRDLKLAPDYLFELQPDEIF